MPELEKWEVSGECRGQASLILGKKEMQMRLFAAVRFSPEVQAALREAIVQLKQQGDGRFTYPDNLHLTLAFIGETNRVREAEAAIQSCTASPFEIKVGGAGHFGDLYWIGIAPNPELKRLAESVQDALREQGFYIERQTWKPHITIARQVSFAAPPRITVSETDMMVDRIALMKSERINGRLVYTEIFGRKLDKIQ